MAGWWWLLSGKGMLRPGIWFFASEEKETVDPPPSRSRAREGRLPYATLSNKISNLPGLPPTFE